ncbi:unnamed protein product [Trifolium pratense]|uniref:Uncharacterized protein n=1 Tax=Trifolium pratense TaxID=57577 RepID=A0ACB0JPB6_TRIPR|nr:unnamed protein product [Trifolium pratense]
MIIPTSIAIVVIPNLCLFLAADYLEQAEYTFLGVKEKHNKAAPEAVFSQTKPIATSVKDGFNVCIFAYGQTRTSKTFTMEGTPEERGVNYRTLEELFRISEERKGVMKYDLHVSMLEVYNENIRDLLVENSTQPTKNSSWRYFIISPPACHPKNSTFSHFFCWSPHIK